MNRPTAALKGPPAGKSNWLMESLRVIMPLLILAAGVLVLIGARQLKPNPTREVEPERPPRVETALVESVTGGLTINTDGSVVPFREIQLSSEVEGRIVQKSPDSRAGYFVSAGTVLLRIDPTDYEINLRQLQEELRQAEITVHQIDVEIANNRSLSQLAEEDRGLQVREIERLERLRQGNAVAVSELDQARSTGVLRRNAVQILKNQAKVLVTRRAAGVASIDLIKTRIEKAKIDLARTTVHAPVDGVIVADMVEENSFVRRGDPLLTLEDTSAVEVMCKLRTDQLAWLTASTEYPAGDHPTEQLYEIPQVPTTVSYQIGGCRYTWKGHLSRYDGIGLDSRTRMVPCRILIDDPAAGTTCEADGVAARSTRKAPTLVRGMFVRVTMHVDPDLALAKVPEEAVRLGDVVWTVVDGKLRTVPVRIARRLDDAVLIEMSGSELALGDHVVVSPLANPTEGMALETSEVLAERSIPAAKDTKKVSAEIEESEAMPL